MNSAIEHVQDSSWSLHSRNLSSFYWDFWLEVILPIAKAIAKGILCPGLLSGNHSCFTLFGLPLLFRNTSVILLHLIFELCCVAENSKSSLSFSRNRSSPRCKRNWNEIHWTSTLHVWHCWHLWFHSRPWLYWMVSHSLIFYILLTLCIIIGETFLNIFIFHSCILAEYSYDACHQVI